MHGTPSAQGPTPPTPAAPAVAASLKAIDAGNMLKHIKVLASDEFEGRSPGTKGETLTVAYIKRQFTRLGLASGNPDGTYVQQVPMRGVTSTPKLAFNASGKATPLNFPGDFVAFSPHAERDIRVDASEVVFVGYGVVAPEFGWDDYKGADLRGQTLVMLINDTPVPDPNDSARLDPAVFKGEGMTYYGRWTYKYEMAAKLGAAAAIIVHETKPAAYPYEVVINSRVRGLNRYSTAHWTMRRGWRCCSSWPRRTRPCRQRRSAPLCLSPRQAKSRDCWARNTTCTIRSARCIDRWSTSISMG